MGKLLLAALIGYVAYRVVRRAFTAALPPQDAAESLNYDKRGRRRIIEGGEMVACHACQTFVPKSTATEARIGGELAYFCSEQCQAHAL